jgi:hypothetical protein
MRVSRGGSSKKEGSEHFDGRLIPRAEVNTTIDAHPEVARCSTLSRRRRIGRYAQ